MLGRGRDRQELLGMVACLMVLFAGEEGLPVATMLDVVGHVAEDIEVDMGLIQ